MNQRIKICRVYTPPASKSGYWILIDKLWPRGFKKEALDFDLWLKEIAPSTALRQWFHEAPLDHWGEFVSRYTKELKENSFYVEKILKMAKEEPVTLFYAAKDPCHNHAIILQEVLGKWSHSFFN